MAFIDGELEKKVETESIKAVDNCNKTNAKNASSVGLKITIDRTYDGVGIHEGKDPCQWCMDRAGHWSYAESYEKGVWERHEGCGCEIIYNCARGSMRQTDWRSNTWGDIRRDPDIIIRNSEKYNTFSSTKQSVRGIIKSSKKGIPMKLQFFAEKDIQNQSSTSLKRGIRKLQKQIEEHKSKISNPKSIISDWDLKEKQEQSGLIRHWEKEIHNFEQSINNRIEELKKRGEYYE